MKSTRAMNRCMVSGLSAGSARRRFSCLRGRSARAANRSIDSGAGGRHSDRADAANQETEILQLSPAVRAYSGQILLGVILLGLAIGLAVRARSFSWPPWIALVPLACGVLLLLRVWIRVKSCHYRLTTQRLFVRRGWLARRVDELELYRVKDVVVNQGICNVC